MDDLNAFPPLGPAAGGSEKADVIEPAVLLLSGQHVVSKAVPEAPLYEMSRDVTYIPQKNSSIIFERVEDAHATEADINAPENEQKQHLFYLAHPAGAEFQVEIPAYYLTAVSREATLGNISLRSTKPLLQRPEFEAVLSATRTAADKPLFDENPKVIFSIRPKLLTGRHTWFDSDGNQVAAEEQKGSQRTLNITVSMKSELRDALVATWCLKVWHDTAESPQTKRDGKSNFSSLNKSTIACLITDLNSSAMERLTPAEGLLGYGSMSKTGKRVGALGSLAGAG